MKKRSLNNLGKTAENEKTASRTIVLKTIETMRGKEENYIPMEINDNMGRPLIDPTQMLELW